MQIIAQHKYYVLLSYYNVLMDVIIAKLALQKYLMGVRWQNYILYSFKTCFI